MLSMWRILAQTMPISLDGDLEGNIEYENFNASGAKVTVHGNNVHPGSAKDIMVNSQTLAMEFHSMLPKEEVPEKTSGYEGFYHLTDMQGDVEKTELLYIIRDHDLDKFHAKEENMRRIARKLNEKYGQGTVELEIKESYRNMRSQIEGCMEIIDWAKEATRMAGLTPKTGCHPRRHRRRQTFLYGLAMSESGYRRLWISRSL